MAELASEGSHAFKESRLSAEVLSSSTNEVYEKFEDMSLNQDLVRGIYDYGFEKPSENQQKGIVHFHKGRNVLQIAEYEPGNRTIFCVGILQQLDIPMLKCQGLVLVHNLTLAEEIEHEMLALGKHLKVKVHVIGLLKTAQNLNPFHVLVGRPYDVYNAMQKKLFDFEDVKILVLDEADNLHSQHLDMVYKIFKLLPLQGKDKVQVGVFSETMPKEVVETANKLMKTPVEIERKQPYKLSIEGIKKHLIVRAENAEQAEDEGWKYNALHKLYEEPNQQKIIVLVNTLKKIEVLRKRMENEYGNKFLFASKFMDQKARDKMKKDFSEIRVLITNEMLARGIIDAEQVHLVVNFDLPREYLRRVGQFKGVSVVNFVTNEDWYYLFDFQTDLSVVFEPHITSETEIPLLEEVPIERDESIKHFVYNGADEDAKFEEFIYFLGEKLAIVPTILFVDTCERAALLANELKEALKERGRTVTTSRNDENSKNIRLEFDDTYNSYLLIRADRKDLETDVVKVPFVVHYNLPKTPDVYYQRIAWCGRDGAAMYIPTDCDWWLVFRIQRLCKVVLKWFPEDLDTLFNRWSTVKLSYNNLSEEQKLCFLFCCLFPGGFHISEDHLFHYMMGENLLPVDTFQKARRDLHEIVLQLTSLSLLLQDKSGHITMHNVVRDSAIAIASGSEEGRGFIVTTGMPVRDGTEVNKLDECERLSFIMATGNHITWSPPNHLKAAHLLTLSFHGNEKLLEIPADFFKETPSLLILDLSYSGIKVLPESIIYLVKLRSLLLEGCLFESASLSKGLDSLEILSLRKSKIKSFMVSGNVTTLKLLDLSGTLELHNISPNIISSFIKLEELYLHDNIRAWESEKNEPSSLSKAEKAGGEYDGSSEKRKEYASLSEVASLTRLSSLEFRISNRECLSQRVLHWEKLDRFKIIVGVDANDFIPLGIRDGETLGKSMYIKLDNRVLANWVKLLLGRTELLQLMGSQFLNDLVQLDRSPEQAMIRELKVLILSELESGTSLIACDQLLRLQNLNKLVVTKCKRLERLIDFGAGIFSNIAALWVFPKLTYLRVSDCSSLKFLFPMRVIRLLSQLEELHISNCSSMSKVIEDGMTDDDREVFPKLKVLDLHNLCSLNLFVWVDNNLSWHDMEELTVNYCGRLKRLPLDVYSAPRLRKFIVDDYSELLNNENVCRVMNRISRSGQIRLTGDMSLKDELLDELYSALRSLAVYNYKGTSLMPCDLLRSFSNLDRLVVSYCSRLEKMIDFQGQEKEGEEQVPLVDTSVASGSSSSVKNEEFFKVPPSLIFPNLTFLKVSECSKLRYLLPLGAARDMMHLKVLEINKCFAMEMIFSHEMGENNGSADTGKGLLPNLTVLKVSECFKLRYLLPMGAARHMVHLKIYMCHSMEMMIEYENVEDGGDAAKDKVILPNLEELSLEYLPKLRSIVGQDILFDWPSLEKLRVVECPVLKKLPLGPACMPKLQKCSISPKKWWDELEWEDEEVKSRVQSLPWWFLNE